MEIGPFSGMNNLAADHALPQGSMEGLAAVRNAVNTDFDNAGKGSRRQGMTKRYGSSGLKGGFGCSFGLFAVEHGRLKSVNTTTWLGTTLAIVTGTTFTFHEFNGAVYFSDGLKSLKIVNNVATVWGLDNPPTPIVNVTSGTFNAGVYLACMTYVDTNGNESGASDFVSVTGPANCGLTFTHLPHPNDARITAMRLYLTTPDNDIFFQCGEVALGVTSYQVLFDYDGGKVLDTLWMTRPPAGQIIREQNGRLLIAQGSVLYVTVPYSPDLISQLSDSYFQFPADITVCEPVDDGVWIVADQTYFLSGTPDNWQQLTKLDYGAALGTGKKLPDNVTWFSERGQIIAGNGGEIKNVQENQVAPDYSSKGTMLIREDNGLKQAITTLINPTMSPRANRAYTAAETIRRA